MDLSTIRILRLVRLFTIFKLSRYYKSIKMIGDVLKETRSELLVTLFICTILMLFSSTLMFYIEHEAQPEKFANVGHSMWWAVATLTTVGYGDIYPVTVLGRFLGAIIALVGIGFVALPTGIFGSAFISKINQRRNESLTITCKCPHCKEEISVSIGQNDTNEPIN